MSVTIWRCDGCHFWRYDLSETKAPTMSGRPECPQCGLAMDFFAYGDRPVEPGPIQA